MKLETWRGGQTSTGRQAVITYERDPINDGVCLSVMVLGPSRNIERDMVETIKALEEAVIELYSKQLCS